MFRSVVVTVGLLAAGAGLAAGCGSDASATPQTTSSSITTTEATTIASDVIIIDVRTPEEFAQGHLDGAINLDVESGAFESGLADLDPSASYAVYCRSGRRSALAADVMAEKGFSDVADLGSIESAAAATGLPVTTD